MLLLLYQSLALVLTMSKWLLIEPARLQLLLTRGLSNLNGQPIDDEELRGCRHRDVEEYADSARKAHPADNKGGGVDGEAAPNQATKAKEFAEEGALCADPIGHGTASIVQGVLSVVTDDADTTVQEHPVEDTLVPPW